MAVTTYDGHSWLCQACLGANDVDNTVMLLSDRENCDVVLRAVLHKCCHLLCRLWLGDRQVLVLRRDVVVGACRHLLWAEDLYPTTAQARKCLRTCHLVNILSIYVEHARATINGADCVCIPNLIEKCIHR